MTLHQYVCPQVWAWKKGRIPDLGRTLDTLYCLFDFEPELFQGYPVDARFVRGAGDTWLATDPGAAPAGTYVSVRIIDPAGRRSDAVLSAPL